MSYDGLAAIAKLAAGQAIVIDASGNARILNPGESLNPNEVIIEQGPEQSAQATLSSSDGTQVNITDDVNQVLEAIEQGQDPAELSEELDPGAGSEDTSSGTLLDTVFRSGDETIAATLFETQGFERLGLSTTQQGVLLDIFREFSSIASILSPNTPPLSEDFTVLLDSDGLASVRFNSPVASEDHISDLEDDAVNTPLSVVITSLPKSGTLLYDGEPVTEDMLTLFDDGGAPIGELQKFDPELFSYQNDQQSTGFILGVKEEPEGREGDESTTAFLNWGEATDDPNIRVLNFTDENDDVVDQIFITTSGSVPTQYYGDKNHIGYGLGVGDGNGINQGETINIDLSQRPAGSLTLGLDGMGGWFEEGHPKETKVVIRVTLDDGSVIEQLVTKTTSGNAELFKEITIDVPPSSDASITNVELSTEGPGNWELRYLETNVPDDSFDYRAVDSDNNVSEESTVTLGLPDNNPPVAIDDPEGFSVAYGSFNEGSWEYNEGEIEAAYDGQSQQISGDGLKRGVSGDENGGPANQIQFNREEGISEQFIFNLEKPATEFSFTFSNLFKNEGGQGNHEQGKWVAYLGNTAVASAMFIANDGSNQGNYSFSGDVAFDRVVFEAVDFVNEPARGTDSSDYFLTGFTASGSGAYAANQGEVLQIPIEELLGNDFDPDSDAIRFTHVSEVNNAQIWVEDGIVYVDLDDDFSGPTTFDYEITDDKGGFSEATVSIIVNPEPVEPCVHCIYLQDDAVVEGDNLVFRVELNTGVLSAAEFAILIGLPSDQATLDDVDLSSAQFTHGVTYNPISQTVTVPVGVSEFSVVLPTLVDELDEGVEDITLMIGGITSTGDIVDVLIEQEEDSIISYHDFDQIDVGNKWSYLDVENLNTANTQAGIADGAEGVWGTDNKNDIIEVGHEPIYRGNLADDKNNQVFELEARRGDNQLYTEISNAREGQFYTLAFDVARRGYRYSPMAIFLESSDGISRELLYTYDQDKDWTSEIIHFQTSGSGDYRVVFESEDSDSYGALLDNIKLETLNNVGVEDGFFPINNITVALAGNELSLDQLKVKLDVSELPEGTQYKLGNDELSVDNKGSIDVSDYQGDLSGLSLNVAEPGNYTFNVVVLTADNTEVKTSPVDITVLPEGSLLQQGSESIDTLGASLGDEILFGLGGGDTFVWQAEDFDGGTDVIGDFTIGEDSIDLSDLLEPGETIDDILENVIAEVNDNDVTLTINKGGQSQSIQINNIADQLGNNPISEQLALIITDPNNNG
ncbi:Ig-like domain-containing protein [Vibrio rhodolitus]|uniref:Ig-like domain-containing protein n=1 Tax=Vibrio rhodolitus TaxID=2231649 RepID=UPI0013E05023|nr:cadherin-like domain-containing protein [Vibrio rhodolitus]